MVKEGKQNWEVGAAVKVGFVSLQVIAKIPTPGDYAPDAYILANAAGTKLYKFVPHNGLQSITLDEGKAMLAEVDARAAREAAKAIEAARTSGNLVSQLLEGRSQ